MAQRARSEMASSRPSQMSWISELTEELNRISGDRSQNTPGAIGVSSLNTELQIPNFVKQNLTEEILHQLGYAEDEIRHVTQGTESSKTEEHACTQDELGSMSEIHTTSSRSSSSQELTKGDLSESESNTDLSQISQDEDGNACKMDEKNDSTLQQNHFLFQTPLKNFPSDTDYEESSATGKLSLESNSENSSQKEDLSFSSTRDKSSVNEDRLQSYDEEFMTKHESPLQSHVDDQGTQGLPLRGLSLSDSMKEPQLREQGCCYDVQMSSVKQNLLCGYDTEEPRRTDMSSHHTQTGDSSLNKDFVPNVGADVSSARKQDLKRRNWEANYLEHEVKHNKDSVTGHSVENAETLTTFQNEMPQNSLEEGIDYIRSLIQANRLVKQGIKNKLFKLSTEEMNMSNFSTNRVGDVQKEETEAGDNSSTSPGDQASADNQKEHREGEIGKKVALLTQINNTLRQQVKTLQDEISHFKEAKLCLSTYREILKMYESQNTQLKKERSQLEEKTESLDEVIKTLQQDQAKQQNQILDLQYDNISLRTKIEELQAEVLNKQHLIENITKLEKCIKELNDDNSKIMLEKDGIENSYKTLWNALTEAQQGLHESETTNKALKIELEKLNVELVLVHEKYKSEMEFRNQSINQCSELKDTLQKKEEEIKQLRNLIEQLKSEVESAISSLETIKEEKENTEKQFSFLKFELNKKETDCWLVKEHYETKYSRLLSEVEMLQAECENERAETEKLKHLIDEVKDENQKLQRLAVMEKELKEALKQEAAKWRQQLDQVSEEKDEKDIKLICSDLSPEPLYEKDCIDSTCTQRATQLLSKVNNLLALTEGILVYQETDANFTESPGKNPESGHLSELKEKIKGLNTKKKCLEKELQERRESVSSLRESMSSRKSAVEQTTEDMETIPAKTENDNNVSDLLKVKIEEYYRRKEEQYQLIDKMETLLGKKSEECMKLTGEKLKLKKHVKRLACQVHSLSEIIQCADQRIQMSTFQVARLEKRNHDLMEALSKQLREGPKQKERSKVMLDKDTKHVTQAQDAKLKESDVKKKQKITSQLLQGGDTVQQQ